MWNTLHPYYSHEQLGLVFIDTHSFEGRKLSKVVVSLMIPSLTYRASLSTRRILYCPKKFVTFITFPPNFLFAIWANHRWEKITIFGIIPPFCLIRKSCFKISYAWICHYMSTCRASTSMYSCSGRSNPAIIACLAFPPNLFAASTDNFRGANLILLNIPLFSQ